MTWDELCLLIINPKTGKPISKDTLAKVFAEELAAGRSKLKKILLNAWLDTVENGEGYNRSRPMCDQHGAVRCRRGHHHRGHIAVPDCRSLGAALGSIFVAPAKTRRAILTGRKSGIDLRAIRPRFAIGGLPCLRQL